MKVYIVASDDYGGLAIGRAFSGEHLARQFIGDGTRTFEVREFDVETEVPDERVREIHYCVMGRDSGHVFEEHGGVFYICKSDWSAVDYSPWNFPVANFTAGSAVSKEHARMIAGDARTTWLKDHESQNTPED